MKPTVIDPKTTSRAEAYELWMNAEMRATPDFPYRVI